MADPKSVLNSVKIIFTLGCFALAAYYGVTQVIRYLQNKDMSVITHKRFNHVPNNKYPIFTICLKGKEIYWRKDSR